MERRLNHIPPVDMEHTAMISRMDARSVAARQQQREGFVALERLSWAWLGAGSTTISTISTAAMVDQSREFIARIMCTHMHTFNGTACL